MGKYVESPIGASPSWYIIPKRIQDLSSGISNFTEHERIGSDKEVTKLIRLWVTEIICHCDTLDRLQEEYEFTNADILSNGTHLIVRDKTSMQLVFKCRLDNIDCFEKSGR